MLIEFDPDKDAGNRQKHGLSLADRERLNLIFTMRGNVLRAISLRKAKPKEERRYEQGN